MNPIDVYVLQKFGRDAVFGEPLYQPAEVTGLFSRAVVNLKNSKVLGVYIFSLLITIPATAAAVLTLTDDVTGMIIMNMNQNVDFSGQHDLFVINDVQRMSISIRPVPVAGINFSIGYMWIYQGT